MRHYTSVCNIRGTIVHRGYEDGRPFSEKVKYQPYLFLETDEENSKYRTLTGKNVRQVDFDSLWDMRSWLKDHDAENFRYYGTTNPITTFIYDNYAGEIKFDASAIRVGIIDIELDRLIVGHDFIERAPGVITTITLKMKNHLIAFGMKDYQAPEHVKYLKCRDEATMLRTFLTVWGGMKLDCVTGWNIFGFDIPYLVNRIHLLLGDDAAKSLSPWNDVRERRYFDALKKPKKTYDITGIQILDYQEFYKKFSIPVEGQLESYSLNYVCYHQLGETKIDYSEFGSLMELYESNFQKFMDYNIHDVVLIERLDQKMKYLNLIFQIAYLAKCNFQEVLKTLPIWEAYIHHYLRDRRIVVPQAKEQDGDETIPGGYVKEPVPGMYDWVVSFDVSSLYPHLIVQFGLSPETLISRICIENRKKELKKTIDARKNLQYHEN